jgi:hypothetical protein
VKEIAGDGERRPTEAFSGLQSHYLFAAKFGRPGKGNDKGNVEGLVGYARRNFMVPVPNAVSWEEWNRHLGEQCVKRRHRTLWGHKETIAERSERDREKLLPLPAAPLEASSALSIALGISTALFLNCRGFWLPQREESLCESLGCASPSAPRYAFSCTRWSPFAPPLWETFTPPLTPCPSAPKRQNSSKMQFSPLN